MERVSVMCRTTFTPLFDVCLNDWKSDQRSPRDAAALVQLFYQFAKDVAGGNVIRVEFDRSSSVSSLDSSLHSSSSSSSQASSSSASSHVNTNMRNQFNHPLALTNHRTFATQQPRSSLVQHRKRPVSSTPFNTNLPSVHASPIIDQQHESMHALALTQHPLATSPLSPSSPLVSAYPHSAHTTHSKSIQMFCADNSQIIMAVFVNQEFHKDASSIAHSLRDSFLNEFKAELVSYESKRGPPSEDSLAIDTFLPLFSRFQQVIETSGVSVQIPLSAPSTATLPPLASSVPTSSHTLLASASSHHASYGLHGVNAGTSGRTVGSMPDRSMHGITTVMNQEEDYMPSWLQETPADAAISSHLTLNDVQLVTNLKHEQQESPSPPTIVQ